MPKRKPTARKKTARKKKQTLKSMEQKQIPKVILRTRVRVRNPRLKNPYKWKSINSRDMFKNKKIVVLSLPGAFTPTCSSTHLPDYEKKYSQLKKKGVDEVYCMSVNDPFVMKNWGDKLKIKNVKLIPDGNGDFTKKMKALVPKKNLGFGDRSWRYSMFVDNGKIKKIFDEPGKVSNCKTDPFKKSDVNTMLRYLSQQ